MVDSRPRHFEYSVDPTGDGAVFPLLDTFPRTEFRERFSITVYHPALLACVQERVGDKHIQAPYRHLKVAPFAMQRAVPHVGNACFAGVGVDFSRCTYTCVAHHAAWRIVRPVTDPPMLVSFTWTRLRSAAIVRTVPPKPKTVVTHLGPL